MKRFIFLISLLLITFLSSAQNQDRGFKRMPPTYNPVPDQTRKAVVIGMSDYGAGMSLNNTLNDADDMAKALGQIGFEVTLIENKDLQTLETILAKWYSSIKGNDMAVFYFSGHGMEVGSENYLLPVGFTDAGLSEMTPKERKVYLQYHSLVINQVLDNMAAENVGVKLLILDACRENPYMKSWSRGSGGQGLAQIDATEGTYIAFAAGPGHTAADGGNLQNGVFTHFLKQEIIKQGASLDDIFGSVSTDVKKYTNNAQNPFRNTDLGKIYFIPPKFGDNPAPNPSPAPYNTPEPKPAPQRHPAEPDLVFVQGGTFWMGCSGEQGSDCYEDESPLHSVTLSSYYMSKYVVTQKQWQLIMGTTVRQQRDKANSSLAIYGEGDNYPIYYVSWDEAQEFIRRLNAATGKQYRLPTEAEWEYAARGGNKSQGYKYSGSNNLNDVGWYSDNSSSATHPVGAMRPNELGIYDMSGNVWEWCQDWYGTYPSSPQRDPMGASSGSYRVGRGGSWYYVARYARVSRRNFGAPVSSYNSLGFRLACSSN